ncbi:hypothetical protein, partial [Akkermansia sp.]|uniref:hypothetical protein n=2 Tax=Akkermansia TaxID=239934 RepID=UPI003A87EB37
KNLSWKHQRHDARIQSSMKNALEKISKDKEWDEPDLMEYDPDKKEIKFLNKTPKKYSLPPDWEQSLNHVQDNLYYGFGMDGSKQIIIPFKSTGNDKSSF